MGKLLLTIPGLIPDPQQGKVFAIADPASSLYACYFLGNAYEGAAPLKDWSENGRTGVQTGSGIGDYELTGQAGSYVTAPFSGNALCSAHNACTIVGLAQANHDKQLIIGGNYPGAGTEDCSLAFQSDSSVDVYTRWGADSETTTLAIDAGVRDADLIACASVHGLTTSSLFYKLTGGVMQSASVNYSAIGGIGGPNNMRMGYAFDTSFAGPGNIAVAAFYNTALNSTQVEEVLDDLLAIKATYGL